MASCLSRKEQIAVVEAGGDEEESLEELAMALGEEARALREDPEETFADFFPAELPELHRRILGRKDVRALLIETFQEGVRQGATGWVDDNLRQVRPWPFRLDEIRVDVRFHHGEADVLAPPDNAKELAEGIPGSRFHLYPGEGHLSIDRYIKEIVQTLLAT
jgi:pimeloyl-ACP methyl ester carboxylesterase